MLEQLIRIKDLHSSIRVNCFARLSILFPAHTANTAMCRFSNFWLTLYKQQIKGKFDRNIIEIWLTFGSFLILFLLLISLSFFNCFLEFFTFWKWISCCNNIFRFVGNLVWPWWASIPENEGTFSLLVRFLDLFSIFFWFRSSMASFFDFGYEGLFSRLFSILFSLTFITARFSIENATIGLCEKANFKNNSRSIFFIDIRFVELFLHPWL